MASIEMVLFIGSAFVVALLLALFIVQKSITTPFPIIKRRKEENFFLDPETIKQIEFPSIDDPPTVDLSVVIPAYNEEERLPVMLEECMDFLEKNCSSYEVILVSDGSTDGTVELGLKYSKKYKSNHFRVLELVENRGKGGAVRLGVLSARGKYILFADADGATSFADYTKLKEALDSLGTDGIAVGSRAHLEQDSIATRSSFRTVLMHGFHFLVWFFAVKTIKDTQCGFKLLTRSSSKKLFTSMHVERWAFDVELLFLAEKMKIPIKEVAVRWTEIDGSKLTPIWSWLQMGRDLFLIWFRYNLGIWKVHKNKSS